jgi:hypothetical protein
MLADLDLLLIAVFCVARSTTDTSPGLSTCAKLSGAASCRWYSSSLSAIMVSCLSSRRPA